MNATRTEAEAVADSVCALLVAGLVAPARAGEACRVAGITLGDLNDARIRRENGRARPATVAERVDLDLWLTSRLTSSSVQRETSVPYDALFDSPPIAAFIDAASRSFGVGPARLTGPSRTAELARVRQVTMAAARMAGGHSFPAIGAAFNRDHTTVVHACKRVEADPRMHRSATLLCGEVTKEKRASSRSATPSPVVTLASHNRKGRLNGTN